MDEPLCFSCGTQMEPIQEEVLGILFKCPVCGQELSRPFSGYGTESFAPDTPIAAEEANYGRTDVNPF